MDKNKIFIGILTLSFLGASFWFYQIYKIQDKQNLFLSQQVQSLEEKLSSFEKTVENFNPENIETRYIEESSLINTVEEVKPAVVSVIGKKESSQNPYDIFYNPYQKNGEKVKVGGGSGFFYSKEKGLVMTNKHVISDESSDYSVILFDGTELKAQVIAKDYFNDIAVLKVELNEEAKTKIKELEFGNSKDTKVGQKVLAIGNALSEFENSVTSGIISAAGRKIYASDGSGHGSELSGLIQTDAAINLGNSGGPLVNLSGELIGMNTAVSTNGQGIGFAIPVDDLKNVANSVEKYGKIKYPFIGIKYLMLNKVLANRLGLTVYEGALLNGDEQNSAVVSGSPAEKAGLQNGDVILEIDGEKISEDNHLQKIVQNKEIGQKIKLKILRNGEEKILELELVERNL